MFLFLGGNGCSVFLPNELGYAYWKKQKGIYVVVHLISLCFKLIIVHYHTTCPQKKEKKNLNQE